MTQTHIPNGDYASAIETLTVPQAPSLADPADHGLGPLHRLASRQYPPAEQTRQVMAKAPRSRWLRALAAIGVFVVGQVLGMLYVGIMKPSHADQVFAVITIVTWAGPLIAWFGLKHRKLGTCQIQGHPLHTLAELSAGMATPWIEVRMPEEDMWTFGDEHDDSTPSPRRLEVRAAEDLIVSFNRVYVRARAGTPPQGAVPGTPSHANRAIDCLHRALVAELHLTPDQIWEMASECSENINDELGGHVDHAAFVIQRAQHRDTDTLCEGLVRSVDVLRTHFDLTQGD